MVVVCQLQAAGKREVVMHSDVYVAYSLAYYSHHSNAEIVRTKVASIYTSHVASSIIQ